MTDTPLNRNVEVISGFVPDLELGVIDVAPRLELGEIDVKMRLPVRMQKITDRLADDLFTGIAKQPQPGRVDIDDQALLI